MSTNNTKQAAWMAIGSMFSYGFGIVSSMILSRYFNKADYGTYNQVLYVYNTLLTVFTLGLPRAFSYFLPRVENAQAKHLIRKITNLFFALGGVFSLLLFFCSPIIAAVLKNPDLENALKVFSIVPFLMLPTMGLEGILATYKRTKFMALYTALTRLLMLLCVALPVMLWRFGYMEAILGFVVASLISFILALYLKYMPVRSMGNERCDVSYKEILRFSLPLMYASLWGVVIVSADQFFVSRYYGNVVFAEFANGSMNLPFVSVIVGACSTVLSPVFSRFSYEKVDPVTEIFPIWKSVFEKSAKLIYPIVIYCFVFADVLMSVLFGKQYEVSGIYFRIKLIGNFFTLILFAPLLINVGKVKFYAKVHMYTAIILIALEYVSVLTIKTPVAISVISVVCEIGKILVLLGGVSKYFGVKIIQLFPIKTVVKILFPSFAILYCVRFLFDAVFNLQNIWSLTISLMVYIMLFYCWSIVSKLDYISIVKPLLKQK